MAINQLQLPGAFQSPQIDLQGSLAALGQTYQQAQMKAARDQALQGAQLDGSPQSLSALATKLLPYDQQGAMTLAQLANTATNRQQDMAWRQTESQRAQQNADRSFQQQVTTGDRSYALQARAADRADEGPVEQGQQRAEAALKMGLKPGTPEYTNYALTGRLPEANTTVQAQVEQRKAAATGLGITPDSPMYQSYVLTGKTPREDAQPLTATDKKAILEADEGVLAAKTAISSLDRALSLSEKAFSGPMASQRGYAASFLGSTSDTGKAGIATTQMDNEVTSNALSQLKAIFGGAPTEGERKILLDIQGASSQPHEVRKEIFARARNAAEARLKFNEQRANEMRGGTFYKNPNTKTTPTAEVAAATPNAPKLGQLQDGYRFKGGDPADPASWVKASN